MPFPSPRPRLVLTALMFAGAWAAAENAPMPPPDIRTMLPQIHAEDIRRHVYYLASDALQGRLTGTEGERLATEYVADAFKALGLNPAGNDGTFFDPFDFTAGVSLGEGNTLAIKTGGADTSFAIDADWRPLAFSKTGITEAPVVFAGYGIVAPTHHEQAGTIRTCTSTWRK